MDHRLIRDDELAALGLERADLVLEDGALLVLLELEERSPAYKQQGARAAAQSAARAQRAARRAGARGGEGGGGRRGGEAEGGGGGGRGRGEVG